MRNHNKNYKSIPIIIISYNQLFYLKQLIGFLQDNAYTNIVILDNNSTYAPLIEYFKEIKDDVKIHKFNKNYGHRVFWSQDEVFKAYAKGYYVVTDPDIMPLSDCPHDFLRYFKKILNANPEVNKVGI